MKFEEFRKTLREQIEELPENATLGDFAAAGRPNLGGAEAPWAADDVDANIAYVEDPNQLDRINAFVGSMNDQQFLNPYAAVNRVWSKLQIIGLDFDVRSIRFDQDMGEIAVPVTRFHGRFGFNDMDGIVKSDDGISNKIPGGLHLVIKYVKAGGLTTMEMSIEKNVEPTIPAIITFGEELTPQQCTEAFGLNFFKSASTDVWIGPEGRKATPSKSKPEDIFKDGFVRMGAPDVKGGTQMSTFSMIPGRRVYQALAKFLLHERPKGLVVLHFLNLQGTHTTKSIKFESSREAAEYLDHDNPTATHAALIPNRSRAKDRVDA